MYIFGRSESGLYEKKGFNMTMVKRGTSVNMNEVYGYLKRNRKSASDLTRQEYLMFRKGA